MKLPVALLAAFAASACNSQSGNGQASAETAMRPGLWETTVRVVAVEAPTAPPEVQEQLRSSILETPPTVDRSCFSPAEAANPAAALRDRTARSQPGFACELGESLFAGGRIRMTVVCRAAGRADQRQAIVGSYTAETMQAALTGASATQATPLSPAMPVRIESTFIGRRVGDCPEGAAQ